jgi:hypothetical protein
MKSFSRSSYRFREESNRPIMPCTPSDVGGACVLSDTGASPSEICAELRNCAQFAQVYA